MTWTTKSPKITKRNVQTTLPLQNGEVRKNSATGRFKVKATKTGRIRAFSNYADANSFALGEASSGTGMSDTSGGMNDSSPSGSTTPEFGGAQQATATGGDALEAKVEAVAIGAAEIFEMLSEIDDEPPKEADGIIEQAFVSIQTLHNMVAEMAEDEKDDEHAPGDPAGDDGKMDSSKPSGFKEAFGNTPEFHDFDEWKAAVDRRGLRHVANVTSPDGSHARYHYARDKFGNERGHFDAKASQGKINEAADRDPTLPEFWDNEMYAHKSAAYAAAHAGNHDQAVDHRRRMFAAKKQAQFLRTKAGQEIAAEGVENGIWKAKITGTHPDGHNPVSQSVYVKASTREKAIKAALKKAKDKYTQHPNHEAELLDEGWFGRGEVDHAAEAKKHKAKVKELKHLAKNTKSRSEQAAAAREALKHEAKAKYHDHMAKKPKKLREATAIAQKAIDKASTKKKGPVNKPQRKTFSQLVKNIASKYQRT